jgi:hypothetical protein
MTKYANWLSICLATTLVVACGGGGGGGGTAAVSDSLAGVVAVGAPIANAQVTLVCGDGSTKSTTADSSGNYSFTNLAGCTAPYVVKAVGDVGGTSEAYVSVLPTTISGEVNLNVTPITNAIAATLASDGDPLKLANDLLAEKLRLTETAVSSRVTALKASLSGALTTAGLPADFDLMKTKFTPDGTGFDKVLDNLKVDVKSSGVSITNASGSVVDDMQNISGTAPVANFSSSAITISNATNFSNPLPTIPSAVLDNSIANVFQSQLNRCFAAVAASRGSIGSLGTACQSLQIASDYLNDGRTAAQELGWRLTSDLYDNAKFGRPEVIRFLSSDATDTRALVSIPLLRADNVPETIQTVVEQSTTTGGVLKLRGNQRPFLIDVSGSVIKSTRLVKRGTAVSGEKSTFFLTGLGIYLDYNVGSASTKINYVKVTGPALPSGGLFLRKGAAGCDVYFTMMRDSTTSPYSCVGIFQLSSRAATTSDFDNFGGNFGSSNGCLGGTPCVHFADTKMSDADITAIQPGASYKFEIFGTSTGCGGAQCPNYTFYQRLRSRPYTMGDVATQSGEVDKIKWNEGISQATIDSIIPVSGATPATLNSLTLSYVRNLDAAPPFKSYIQVYKAGTLQNDAKMLPIAPNYVAGTEISVTLNNSGSGWTNPQTNNTNSASNYNWIELLSRNKFGTVLDRQWRW